MYHSMSVHLEDQLNVCEKRAGHISQENKKLAMLRLGTIMNPQHLQGCIFAVHGMAWQSMLFRISYQSFSKILPMLSLMITHRTGSNQELVLQFILQTLTLQFHDI